MKRILYIGNALKSTNANQTYLTTLTNNLVNEGYCVIKSSEKSNKLLRLLDMCLTLISNRKKVDLVLIDTYSTLNFYYALIISELCRIFKLKYIPILHGGNLQSRLKSSSTWSRRIFEGAYINIAPSKFLKEVFKNHQFLNVITIPNSLVISQYEFRNVNQPKTIKIFWLRAFSKIYNPLLAIKVLDALRKRGFDAELCMVGPDKDGTMQSVKQLAKDLKLSVMITGKLSKLEWVDLSKEYNMFINTTNYDNMPVSVIEMMALGIPVVSTNVGGMPFLIENEVDGLLVEPDNVDHMVEAIIRLYENPQEAKRLAKNARKKVEQYDWSVVKHQWKELLG